MKVSLIVTPFLALFMIAPSLQAHARAGLDELHEKAPGFSFEGPQGETHHLSDYKGQNLILHFWASWCLPCKREIPELLKLKARWGKRGPKLLFVSADDKKHRDAAKDFIRGTKSNVPLLFLEPSASAQKYIGWGLPVTYFINSSQIIVARKIGPLDWQKLSLAKIKKELKLKKGK